MSGLTVAPHRVTRARRHRIAVLATNGIVKLLQVQFERDGSLFVHFPYHPEADGVAGDVAYVRSEPLKETFEREGVLFERRDVQVTSTTGMTTTRRPKYSHHVDGRCAFSQDRQVYTKVRASTRRLDMGSRHLFSVDVENLASFEPFGNESRQAATLFLHYPGPLPYAIHLTAYWMNGSGSAEISSLRNPLQLADKHGGVFATAWAVAPPSDSPVADYFLAFEMSSMSRISRPARDHDFLLLFTGGFRLDSSQAGDIEFLMLQWPAVGIKDFVSMDFPRSFPEL